LSDGEEAAAAPSALNQRLVEKWHCSNREGEGQRKMAMEWNPRGREEAAGALDETRSGRTLPLPPSVAEKDGEE